MRRRSMQSVLAGRGFMLFPAAAFAVHQLRYELAYGDRSGQALTAQGHGYMNSLAPWVVVLIALAFGSFLARLADAAGGRRDERPRRAFVAIWAVAWFGLLGAYCAQEWLEGVFAAGHPAGLAGVFGHGGWWAVALSAVAALAVTALLRIGSIVLEAIGRRASRFLRLASLILSRPLTAALSRRAPLAGNAAGRAPPGTCLAA